LDAIHRNSIALKDWSNSLCLSVNCSDIPSILVYKKCKRLTISPNVICMLCMGGFDLHWLKWGKRPSFDSNCYFCSFVLVVYVFSIALHLMKLIALHRFAQSPLTIGNKRERKREKQRDQRRGSQTKTHIYYTLVSQIYN
jgi:hypothetical protein